MIRRLQVGNVIRLRRRPRLRAVMYFGHEEEASVAAKEVLKVDPKFSLEQYAKTIAYKEKSQIDLVTNAWRKAGLR